MDTNQIRKRDAVTDRVARLAESAFRALRNGFVVGGPREWGGAFSKMKRICAFLHRGMTWLVLNPSNSDRSC